eukprot:COSAG01_NODE_162_length_23597_cov_21.924130_11_plen_193_part_00
MGRALLDCVISTFSQSWIWGGGAHHSCCWRRLHALRSAAASCCVLCAVNRVARPIPVVFVCCAAGRRPTATAWVARHIQQQTRYTLHSHQRRILGDQAGQAQCGLGGLGGQHQSILHQNRQPTRSRVRATPPSPLPCYSLESSRQAPLGALSAVPVYLGTLVNILPVCYTPSWSVTHRPSDGDGKLEGNCIF